MMFRRKKKSIYELIKEAEASESWEDMTIIHLPPFADGEYTLAFLLNMIRMQLEKNIR